MPTLPIIPESAPFTAEQRAWLNGFLAGFVNQGGAMAAPAAPAGERPKLLIAFGSQSGNAESLAKKLGKEAAARGFAARVSGMEALQPAALAGEPNLLVVTSTWGDGEMPDNAADFWSGLNQNGSSPKLEGVRFSVLALGDRNYGDTFCQAGRLFDERLEALGAARLHPRTDCDVDFDDAARQWMDGVLGSLESAGSVGAAAAVVSEAAPSAVEEGYTKKNPFPAKLIANAALNGEGSSKDTRHIAFCLKGSGLAYETGDALGVFVRNCPEVVASVVAAHGLDPEAPVPAAFGGEAPLREALESGYEVRGLLGRQPDKPLSPVEFVESLRKLQPRLYSIASSQKAHPDEVHLCVGAVRYTLDGVAHKGVASTYLADRCGIGGEASIYVHRAKHFRVPEDPATPIVMVGPGTGIAPFRAFVQERQASGATGKNWLFFGDQKSACDFLYRDELEAWSRDGVLSRLDLAFSRDQERKIYVQDRMAEAAGELWSWLEEGAHFYVCGDASRMARDVDAALHRIVQTAGGRSEEDAAAYVSELKQARRYARDVY